MLASAPASMLVDWLAFSSLEPFGPPAEYHRTGIVAHLIANTNRKRGTRPFSPGDFMDAIEGIKKRSHKQTDKELRSVLEGWRAVHDTFSGIKRA